MGFGVVYVATNTVNGDQYVGLTRMGVATRWAQHMTKSNTPKTYFHRAIAKYGATASATGRVWSKESKAKLSASCMGRKYGSDVIARMAESKKRPIQCDTTGVVYTCRTEAAQACGVGARSIQRVCGGEYPSVKGLKFSYIG